MIKLKQIGLLLLCFFSLISFCACESKNENENILEGADLEEIDRSMDEKITYFELGGPAELIYIYYMKDAEVKGKIDFDDEEELNKFIEDLYYYDRLVSDNMFIDYTDDYGADVLLLYNYNSHPIFKCLAKNDKDLYIKWRNDDLFRACFNKFNYIEKTYVPYLDEVAEQEREKLNQ